MRIRYLAGVLYLSWIGLVGPTARCAVNDDHLRPASLERNLSYRKLSLSKLCFTKFDCGRAFTIPAFAPESCLSIYSKAETGARHVYLVTYVTARDSLWQRTDGGNQPKRAEGLKVLRCDAEIPAKTAELLRSVWHRMLAQTRPEKPLSASEWRMISIDGTNTEFSIERPHETPLYGTLNTSLPAPGEKTKEFLGLSNALTDYCKARPADRPAISRKIDRKAIQLLQKFKHH
jgi:hypothetical protein